MQIYPIVLVNNENRCSEMDVLGKFQFGFDKLTKIEICRVSFHAQNAFCAQKKTNAF